MLPIPRGGLAVSTKLPLHPSQIQASGAQCRKANIIPLIFDVISTYRPHQEHCTARFTNSRWTARDRQVYSIFSPSLRDILQVSERGFDFVPVWKDFESLKLKAKRNLVSFTNHLQLQFGKFRDKHPLWQHLFRNNVEPMIFHFR